MKTDYNPHSIIIINILIIITVTTINYYSKELCLGIYFIFTFLEAEIVK